jgi:acetyl esterase/lipase
MEDAETRLANLVNPSVVLTLPEMEQVRVHRNLVYCANDDPNLRLDVYQPPVEPSNARFPIVLLIHGGAGAAMRPKDWGFFQSWGRLLAASGLVAVTFTHRQAGPPDMLLTEAAADVHAAIQFVRQNALQWSADGDRVGVAAWSLGGVLLSGLLREKPAYLRCILAFCPMLDLQQWAPPAAEPAVLATLKAFSPVASLQAQEGVPPMFIARAGRDGIPLLNDGLDRFVSGALGANVPLTLMNHPEGIHGFDNQNHDDRSREILRAAIAFARNHLGVA